MSRYSIYTMVAKADVQGVIGSTNVGDIKTACLNSVAIDNATYQPIEQGEFLAYKCGALQQEV